MYDLVRSALEFEKAVKDERYSNHSTAPRRPSPGIRGGTFISPPILPTLIDQAYRYGLMAGVRLHF